MTSAPARARRNPAGEAERSALTGAIVFSACTISFILWLCFSEGLHNHVRFLLDMASRLLGR